MEVKRSFYPIGQGAFYGETFYLDIYKKFNMIYDCGTNTKIENVKIDKIMDTIDFGDRVDLLVISHFDADHISQISKLKERAGEIKKILIPLVSKEVQLLNLVMHIDEDDSFYSENMGDLEEYIKKLNIDAQIIKVKSYEQKTEIENDSLEISDENLKVKEINSGTSLELNGKQWAFIPFYKEDVAIIKNLITKIEVAFSINTKNPEEILEIIREELQKDSKETIRKLKKCYKDSKVKKNEYSLCLYSGPSISNQEPHYKLKNKKYTNMSLLERKFRCYYCFIKNSENKKNGCLYTGDYNANEDITKLEECYDSVKEEIGTVQIPHHGSKENYKPNVIFNADRAIISAGKSNRYNHPDAEVVKDILKECDLKQVTEDLKSQYDEILILK